MKALLDNLTLYNTPKTREEANNLIDALTQAQYNYNREDYGMSAEDLAIVFGKEKGAELEKNYQESYEQNYAIREKAFKEKFRPKIGMAFSYFLGGKDSFCIEDEGFALKPWVEVKFENSGFIIEENRAIAMGNYFFTDSKGSILKVEYTFGYKLSRDKLIIDLHHSSLPFS